MFGCRLGVECPFFVWTLQRCDFLVWSVQQLLMSQPFPHEFIFGVFLIATCTNYVPATWESHNSEFISGVLLAPLFHAQCTIHVRARIHENVSHVDLIEMLTTAVC